MHVPAKSIVTNSPSGKYEQSTTSKELYQQYEQNSLDSGIDAKQV